MALVTFLSCARRFLFEAQFVSPPTHEHGLGSRGLMYSDGLYAFSPPVPNQTRPEVGFHLCVPLLIGEAGISIRSCNDLNSRRALMRPAFSDYNIL